MTKAPAHLKSLTSMRAFAALLVFLFHAQLPHMGAFTGQGRVGVSFFFLLSGLLLGLRFREDDTARDFYRRRIARIYPAYLVALAAGFVIARMSGEHNPPSAGLTIVLLQAWVPDEHVFFAWNAVAWSLSVEAFFYALFPLIAPTILRLSPARTRVLQLGCVLLVLALGDWGHLAAHGSSRSADLVSWAVYILPVSRLAEFVLGLTLVSVVRGPRVPVPKALATGFFVVCFLLAGTDPFGFGLVFLTLLPIALLLVVFSQADMAGERSILHDPVAVRLGEWSFCFYLVHLLALQTAGRFLDGAFPLSVPAGGLVLALAGSYALHTVVEKPCDRLLNGRSRRGGHRRVDD